VCAESSKRVHGKAPKQSTFVKHPWIERHENGFFCRDCRKYGEKAENHLNRGVWINVPLPLTASRKLYEKADKHAASSQHRMAVAANESSNEVASQVIRHANRQTSRDADCMKKLLRAAYFLFTSEIPHTTVWRSMISTIAACDLSGQLSSFVCSRPANGHHLSSTAITSILEAFGATVVSDLKDRLSSCTEFSVMADECTDVNGVEKLSVCVRYIRDDEILETFLGCWPVPSTKAVDVHASITTHLTEFGLTPSNLIAAAFDGASNMSGEHGGVQALLKRDAPEMIFVHCRSHLLQLALVRASNTVPEIKRVLSSLTKLLITPSSHAARCVCPS